MKLESFTQNAVGVGKPSPVDSPERIHSAAAQFEALLIGQILHQMRASTQTSDDPASATMTEYAEQFLAQTMSASGGFGLSKLIESGLRREPNTRVGQQ